MGPVLVEVLDLEEVHQVVLEAGNLQAHLEAGSGNSEGNRLVEEKACQLEDWEVGHHLVEKEGRACRDRPEEVAHLAYQMVEGACLYRLEWSKQKCNASTNQEDHREMEVETLQHQQEVAA